MLWLKQAMSVVADWLSKPALLTTISELRGRHANIRTVMDEGIVRGRYRLDIVHSSFCLLVFLSQGGLFADGIFRLGADC